VTIAKRLPKYVTLDNESNINTPLAVAKQRVHKNDMQRFKCCWEGTKNKSDNTNSKSNTASANFTATILIQYHILYKNRFSGRRNQVVSNKPKSQTYVDRQHRDILVPINKLLHEWDQQTTPESGGS